MNAKEKMKTVVDLIVETDYQKAKTELKKIISQHPKMQEYKTALLKMDLDLKAVNVPGETYEKIEEALKDFPINLKLKMMG